MPVHWFCSTERIRERFPGGIDRYFPAPHPHPDAFMLGMTYQPDLEKAEASGRPYDILHQHARFYRTRPVTVTLVSLLAIGTLTPRFTCGAGSSITARAPLRKTAPNTSASLAFPAFFLGSVERPIGVYRTAIIH